MAGIDETIKEIGLATTIIRAAGDVETYTYIKPKLKSAPFDYEGWMMTDSTVVAGDLILASSNHYLIVGLSKDERVGEFFKYNVRLFRCNHTIDIKQFNRAQKSFTEIKSNIPCLIVDKGITQISDKGLVTPGFSGTDDSYSLYCQPNEIKDTYVLNDDANNKLRVAGEINPYFADGLICIPVKIEG
jgi:hypothetical protein